MAEFLCDGKWTSPAKLCIEGRSAGGLLMGASVNMAPHLFSACIMVRPRVCPGEHPLRAPTFASLYTWETWGLCLHHGWPMRWNVLHPCRPWLTLVAPALGHAVGGSNLLPV